MASLISGGANGSGTQKMGLNKPSGKALKALGSKAQGEGVRESGLRTLGFRSQEDRAL
jgi:hypothetical protein